VYKNIGGHTYSTTYSGPIGAVITPHLKGFHDYKHLSFASSLCGSCTEVCPVKIPLHELLLDNRNESVIKGFITKGEKISMNRMKTYLSKRKRMDLLNSRIKNIGIQIIFKQAWGSRKELPRFANKSFREMWMERKGHS